MANYSKLDCGLFAALFAACLHLVYAYAARFERDGILADFAGLRALTFLQ
jgi:hypothetical protein